MLVEVPYYLRTMAEPFLVGPFDLGKDEARDSGREDCPLDGAATLSSTSTEDDTDSLSASATLVDPKTPPLLKLADNPPFLSSTMSPFAFTVCVAVFVAALFRTAAPSAVARHLCAKFKLQMLSGMSFSSALIQHSIKTFEDPDIASRK
jgi:hypothetical protein